MGPAVAASAMSNLVTIANSAKSTENTDESSAFLMMGGLLLIGLGSFIIWFINKMSE